MIAVGSDHGGFALKQAVLKHLEKRGETYHDFGTYTEDSCDYPDFGKAVAHAVAGGEYEYGIIICGTGIGIATRLHNDANILALGARVVGEGLAMKIIDTFLDTPFSNDERHIRRISKIE